MHVYMAHPYEGKEENLVKAKETLVWLIEHYPEHVFYAQWILECELFDDSDEDVRRAALVRDKAVIRKCDQVWLMGDHISDGMQEEAEHADRYHVDVVDFTPFQRRE